MPDGRLPGLSFVTGLFICSAVSANSGGVSLMFDVQPLFDSYCVSCHMLESPQGELVIEQGEAHSNLVKVPSTQAEMVRVDPGNPTSSYLLHKMRGTHLEAGGSGLPMPYGSEVSAGMSADALDLIERWIAEGAPDN